jgi:Cu/Ag efflux protein CusF
MMNGGHGGRGHGGPGMGGRGHGGPGGMMNDGTETSVVKQADGTFITVVRTSGTVSAVGSDSITIALSDGTSKTITIPSTATIDRDRATATLADIAVGDHVSIEGTETDGTLTVTEVRARSAAEVAAHQAQTAPSTSTATNASFSGKSSLKVKKTALAVARTAKA